MPAWIYRAVYRLIFRRRHVKPEDGKGRQGTRWRLKDAAGAKAVAAQAPAPEREATSVERAYEALRAMAIDFTLRPGERLNEGELARKFSMSRVPLREALNRLVSEGLLSAVPNQGFWARKLSVTEIMALFEVRSDLEAAGVVKVAANADDAALAALVARARTMSADVGHASVEDLVARDEAFHLAVSALSGNAERTAMLANINARIRFVRRINLEAGKRMQSSLDEHVAFAEALAARDDQTASRLIREHLYLSAEEAALSVQQGLARIFAEATA